MRTPKKGRVRPWQDGFGGRYRLGHRPVTLVTRKKKKKVKMKLVACGGSMYSQAHVNPTFQQEYPSLG